MIRFIRQYNQRLHSYGELCGVSFVPVYENASSVTESIVDLFPRVLYGILTAILQMCHDVVQLNSYH